MTPQLQAAVERAYKVFSPYSDVFGSRSLEVCRCTCCMYSKSEHELLNTPLHEITADTLAEYTNSAHGWDDAVISREFRYFLPRYLELMAQYNPPSYNSDLGFCLSRIGRAQWLNKWPENEVECVNAFFDELVRAILLDVSHQVPGQHRFNTLDIEDVLSCIHHAGGDLERALKVWDAAPDPGAALNMASLRYEITWSNGEPTLSDWDFDQSMRAEGNRIAAFLRRPEVDERIEAAFFMTENEGWQKILSDAGFLGEIRL